MADLEEMDYGRYKDMANVHADFLCEQVFKPAFRMAFLHGAKHMKDEMENKIIERNRNEQKKDDGTGGNGRDPRRTAAACRYQEAERNRINLSLSD